MRVSLLALLGVPTTILAAAGGDSALKPAKELAPHNPGQTSREERQLLRVEATAAITRGDEVRMVDEMLQRIGRIEATTHELKRLIEAFPLPVPAPPPPAVSPSAPIPKPPARPAAEPVPAVPVADSGEVAGKVFPVSLPLAGGIAGLLLFLGALWQRSRQRPAPSPVNSVKSSKLPLPDSPLTHSTEADRPSPGPNEPVVETQLPGTGETAPTRPEAVTEATEPVPAPAPELVSDTPDRTIEFSSPVTQMPPPASGTPVFETGHASTVAEAGYDQTLELAEIMLSMGLTGEAAHTLVDHIRGNPRQALVHWIKLLEIYRSDGHRADFDRAAREMQQSFNIQATDWLKGSNGDTHTLENFSRVSTHVQELWHEPQECIAYLMHLLEDNREGMRVGFPQPVAEEMLLLVAILRDAEARG